MKRLLAYLLAMIMLLSIGAGAFATGVDTAAPAEADEEEVVVEIDPALVRTMGLAAATADRKSTRLNSSHPTTSRMPSSA